jgi:hypothetical protein
MFTPGTKRELFVPSKAGDLEGESKDILIKIL